MSYTTVIDADKKSLSLNFKELFQYRDLFLILAYRDYKVRYAQTLLGFVWAFLQPVANLVVLTLVFGVAANVKTGEIPYELYAMTGMAAWTYFSFVLNQSGTSIIGAQNMIKKIYFPRLIIPLSKAVVGIIDFGITLLMIMGLMIYHKYWPSSNIVFFPLFIILNFISATAVGIWISSLTIRFRDFKYIVPFFVQFGLYITPVAYPAELVANKLPKWAISLYYLNPMAGIVEGFRWSLLDSTPPNEYSIISFSISVILFVSGLFYFKKAEKVMADLV